MGRSDLRHVVAEIVPWVPESFITEGTLVPGPSGVLEPTSGEAARKLARVRNKMK